MFRPICDHKGMTTLQPAQHFVTDVQRQPPLSHFSFRFCYFTGLLQGCVTAAAIYKYTNKVRCYVSFEKSHTEGHLQ